jgi:Glycogen recognition site of AMP-activated protein kinase/Domain of unknown function (DUF3471)
MRGFCLMLCIVNLSLVAGRPLTQAVPTSTLQQPTARKIDPELLRKYVGRYELEVGIIPISTLDVTLENNELWLKPSVTKKRRLIHKSRTVFSGEIEGTPLSFSKDEDGKIVSLTFVYEGASYTAQRIALPAASLQGNTTFRLPGYADARVVALAGSFNNWNQSQFIFGREGDEWVCRIDLEPGKHAYKFIVDGNWLLDPANPATEDDDYGVKNSVIVVTKPTSPPTPTLAPSPR